METLFDWRLLVSAFGLNTIFIVAILLVQKIESTTGTLYGRLSLVPETNQPFLYWQDFKYQSIGNTIFMPFILYTFLWILKYQTISSLTWVWFSTIGIIDISLFANMCLAKDHKPDWGYPGAGEISIGGLIHLVYHGVYMAISFITLYFITIRWGTDLPCFWFFLGIIPYLATVIWDNKSGRFEKIQRKIRYTKETY